MDVDDRQLRKLAHKLIELFSRQRERRFGFERYWPLVGPVETFSEQAAGELEQRIAKGLQDALQEVLRATAPKSFHLDADTVAGFLNAEPYKPRNMHRHKTASFRQRRRTVTK